MAQDTRAEAAVVLDGSAGWNQVIDAPEVDRPVLLLASGAMVHISWLGFAPGRFQLTTVRGGGHYTVTDLPAFAPDATELCGTGPAARGTDISRRIVRDFLDSRPPDNWPEVDRRSWRRCEPGRCDRGPVSCSQGAAQLQFAVTEYGQWGSRLGAGKSEGLVVHLHGQRIRSWDVWWQVLVFGFICNAKGNGDT
ncbi:hypothetical protein [Nocardia wallacei]|nr:hypothetical protein [Nocardia wallacei]